MSGVVVAPVASAGDWAALREVFAEYVGALDFALSFQDFEREFAELETEYGPPAGAAFLARDPATGEVVGAVGLRTFAPDVAELKRMYVRPAGRGRGAGAALAGAAVAAARALGFRAVRLDTTTDMAAAVAIYERLGFRPIPPYRHNPIPNARFFELSLTT